MQTLRNKLIAAVPSAERATLEARLANVQATIRERLRSNRQQVQQIGVRNLSATARDLKKRLAALG
jgi:hypothetical protein